jgi:hypothetical protein
MPIFCERTHQEWARIAAQVFAQPIFEAVERQVLQSSPPTPKPWLLRMVFRSVFVLLTTLLACMLPFFGDLMGLIASIGLVPISFTLPALLWLSAAPRKGREWWLNVVIAGGSGALAVLALIGSVRNIIVDSARSHAMD